MSNRQAKLNLTSTRMNLITAKVFLRLLGLISVALVISCDSRSDVCDYFKESLTNEDRSYAIIKISVHCEQCLVDLQLITESNSDVLFFITSQDEVSLVTEKLSVLANTNFIIVESNEVNDYFENAFVNSYPSYYIFEEDCAMVETTLNELLYLQN